MSHHAQRTITLAVVVAAFSSSLSHAQFESFLKRVPAGANAIMLIDVEGIYKGPQGAKFKKRHAEAYATRPLLLSPDSLRYAMAANLDLESFEQVWAVATMELRKPPSMDDFARTEGGHVDKLAGKEVVWSPFDVYFVKLAGKRLGVIRPANRRNAIRWIEQEAAWKGASLSDYLQRAVDSASSKGNHVVMAVDLRDVPDPRRAESRIGPMQCLSGQSIDLEKLVKLVCSLQGITLGIQMSNDTRGTITLDFGQDATMLEPILKPFILESFDEFHIGLKDFDTWKASVSGKKVILQGNFSMSGLNMVSSVLELPTPEEPVAQAGGQTGADNEGSAPPSPAEASQAYYRSVIELIDEVSEHAKSTTWLKRTAKRLDRLPVLDVDPDLLAYSGNVAAMLRDAASVMKGGRRTVAAESAGLQPSQGTFYRGITRTSSGAYRTAGVSTNYGERRRIKAEEKARVSEEVFGIFKDIASMTSGIRVQMSQRYELPF